MFLNNRYTMSRWSSDRSSLLSLLLDEVTGDQNTMEIRQDYTKMYESTLSVSHIKQYYTGSKAEGLDLPGSDDDIMFDINNMYNIKVIQSSSQTSDISSGTILYLRTDNVSQGFALLEISRIPLQLVPFIQSINGMQYLSSNLIVQHFFSRYKVITV